MSNVTIPKIEYQSLKERAVAYERMLEAAQGTFSLTPSETSRKKVIASMKKTGKYKQKFPPSLSPGFNLLTYFVA